MRVWRGLISVHATVHSNLMMRSSTSHIPSQRIETGDGRVIVIDRFPGLGLIREYHYDFKYVEWKEVNANGNGKEQTSEEELDTRRDKSRP